MNGLSNSDLDIIFHQDNNSWFSITGKPIPGKIYHRCINLNAEITYLNIESWWYKDEKVSFPSMENAYNDQKITDIISSLFNKSFGAPVFRSTGK